MSGTGMIFFMIFAVALTGMYVAVRRQWVNPAIAAGVGSLTSIIAMVLHLGSDPEVSNLRALFFGLLIGSVFSVATLSVAWYFHSSELRAHYGQQDNAATDEA